MNTTPPPLPQNRHWDLLLTETTECTLYRRVKSQRVHHFNAISQSMACQGDITD